MAGKAVATMVWSATARNIGSMIGGKTVRNCAAVDGSGSGTRTASGWASDAGVAAGWASEGSVAAGWSSDSFIVCFGERLVAMRI